MSEPVDETIGIPQSGPGAGVGAVPEPHTIFMGKIWGEDDMDGYLCRNGFLRIR